MITWSEILKTGFLVESLSRVAYLFTPSEWKDGRAESIFRRVQPRSKLIDEDDSYRYYLTDSPSGQNSTDYTTWALHKDSDTLHASLSWGDPRRGVVTGISTHPDFRRKGIATTLFRKSQAHCFEEGITAPRHAPSLERTTDGDLWVSGLGQEDWHQGEGYPLSF